MQAGIYARISSDRDGDNLGVNRQIADCEILARARGWTITERYVDDDISAYSGKPRPAYQQMLTDIVDRRINAVIIYHLDRLHRQPRELEAFIDLCDRTGNVALASVSGDVDLSTDDGRLVARIQGAVARQASDAMGRRIRRKAQELAEAGKIGGGGHRPFGYEHDRRTIRPDEAAIIRDLAERFLAGETIISLCRDLNERGVKTSSGGAWVSLPLSRILRSGRIAGWREHHGQLVAEAEWPAIITLAESQQIRATFKDRAERPRRAPRRYLLARLLRCGACGELLVARPRGDGVRRYVCAQGLNFHGCGKIAIRADWVEELIVGAVLERLDSPALAAALRGRPVDTAASEWQTYVDGAAGQLQQLAEAWGQQAITMQEWLAARRPVEQRLEHGRHRLATVTRTTAIAQHIGRGVDLTAGWETLPLTRRHAIVASVLDHAVVNHGRPGFNRFEPSRVVPVWRL